MASLIQITLELTGGALRDFVRDVFNALNSLSWQTVVLILALCFHQEMKKIVEAIVGISQRVKKFGDVEIDQLEQQAKPEEVVVSEVALSDVIADDPTLEPWALRAEQLIEEAKLNEKSREKEREKRLIRAWAHAVRAREFDADLRRIFVSQIDALNKLESSPAHGKALKRFHNDHTSRVVERGVKPENVFDFQEWLKFLLAKQFIIKDATGPYRITELGKAFLLHVRQAGTSDAIQL